MDWLTWIIENKTAVVAFLGLIVPIASQIIKWTPSKKDDEKWAQVLKVINMIAMNKSQK